MRLAPATGTAPASSITAVRSRSLRDVPSGSGLERCTGGGGGGTDAPAVDIPGPPLEPPVPTFTVGASSVSSSEGASHLPSTSSSQSAGFCRAAREPASRQRAKTNEIRRIVSRPSTQRSSGVWASEGTGPERERGTTVFFTKAWTHRSSQPHRARWSTPNPKSPPLTHPSHRA